MFLPNLEHRSAVLRRCSQMKYSTSMLVDWSYAATQKYIAYHSRAGMSLTEKRYHRKTYSHVGLIALFNTNRGKGIVLRVEKMILRARFEEEKKESGSTSDLPRVVLKCKWCGLSRGSRALCTLPLSRYESKSKRKSILAIFERPMESESPRI